ncbi:bifunctional apoptosis regulator-like isoform X2 [Carcharodon carcharias]|uniref:bifunctional apoptosis regulator-like isoform X2 n=1 Tax=Carcharodon carcharias TaxID=13397 RepID=UPI001B7ED7D5|nr:bifunctional apoptosis regulator-like isoform X2 [Carcharodon carcharias]
MRRKSNLQSFSCDQMEGDVGFRNRQKYKELEWEELEDSTLPEPSCQLSANEFSCHCCYEILVNPTTLNCGHSFCRHCLALWWDASRKTECPECREKWEGFPKVNIVLRDAVEKLFPDDVARRQEETQNNIKISNSILAFQKYGNEQSRALNNSGQWRRGGGFFSGVLTSLTCVAVVFLVYLWSRETEKDLLVHKPVTKWTAKEVTLWLEQLGQWATVYKERFLEEEVNGRLLLTLGEEEFSKPPFNIERELHRKAILMELDNVKALGVKPPQNLWEYKSDDISLKQWAEFLVKYSLIPYQLIAEFAWDWLDMHYWTSRFIIVNAMLLSVLEGFAFWRLWSRGGLRSIPQKMWSHFWKVSSQGILVAILWPIIPQFICDCLFYWALYFNPIINIDLVVKEVRRLETEIP